MHRIVVLVSADKNVQGLPFSYNEEPAARNPERSWYMVVVDAVDEWKAIDFLKPYFPNFLALRAERRPENWLPFWIEAGEGALIPQIEA